MISCLPPLPAPSPAVGVDPQLSGVEGAEEVLHEILSTSWMSNGGDRGANLARIQRQRYRERLCCRSCLMLVEGMEFGRLRRIDVVEYLPAK